MVVADHPLRPRAHDSAKSVLLTILGEFVVPNGGSVWTGTLVDGLAALGYGDGNARQAIARLRGEVIEPQRCGRQTRWHLTDEGADLLRDGAERIYRFGQRSEQWDQRWLIVICSIPETQREKRRRLHTQLAFAGFGFLAPTVAVSPHISQEAAAVRVLERLDLTDLATVVRAETAPVSPDRELVEQSWDLDALTADYEAFVAEFGPARPDGPDDSFRHLVRLVHAWRRFPFVDPELPAELVPAGWAGNVARHLFADARAAWSDAATAHYLGLETGHG